MVFHKILVVISCFFIPTILYCQIVHLENASFEGEHRDAVVPLNWLPCAEGTTPDILPGPWGVYLEPSDGESYVGLITRENFSWESIAQRLKTPLESGECYQFTLDLAHSDTYSGYNNPIKLRIWGCKSKCGNDQLIYETEFIKHTDWETYTVKFTSEVKIKYLMLEAFYRERPYSYKGNILIDDMSPIKPCKRVMSTEPAGIMHQGW